MTQSKTVSIALAILKSIEHWPLALAVALIFVCGAVEVAYAAPPVNTNKTPSPDSGKMLVITGWGTRLGGAKVYLSDLGIRIKCNQGGAIWLANRPRRAVFVNDENKCFFVVRSRDFKKRYNHMNYDFAGMRTVPLTEKIATTLKLEKRVLKSPNPKQKMGEFICVKNSSLPISSQVLDFYRDTFWGKNAPQDSVPVGMQEFGRRFHESSDPKEDERRWEWIKTLEPSKVEIVATQRSLFRKPAGYRRAKDGADLYFSQGGDLKQSDLQDLFRRNLDIEDKDGDL